jgi:hypothetical protein
MKMLFREPSHHPVAWVFLAMGGLIFLSNPLNNIISAFSGLVFILVGLSELLSKKWARLVVFIRILVILCLFVDIFAFAVLIYQFIL